MGLPYRLFRLVVAVIALGLVAPQSEAQISILVDATRDAGGWWFPNTQGPYDPDIHHQGKALADHMRAQGMQVTELGGAITMTCAMLSQYHMVVAASPYAGLSGLPMYSTSELTAYTTYVSNGGRLILINDHKCRGFCDLDALPLAFGLDFAGDLGIETVTSFVPHAITTGVGSLPFFAGSFAVTAPASATMLGFIRGLPVMGIMPFGLGTVFFIGDVNGIEGVPQPFVDNLLGHMLEGARRVNACCLDSEPPSLSVSLSPVLVWPPNHRLVDVHASVEAQDDCDGAPQIELISITSDELDAGTSAEDLPEDIHGGEIGTHDVDFALRSERAEEGDGRTYAVCYEARDAVGRTSRQCATVEVPHDRRGQATLAGSSGPWSLTIYGSATMEARDVVPGSVMVAAGLERAGASEAAPAYGDVDGDGREDVTLALTAGLSAGSPSSGDPWYARWVAGDQGYLAEIDPNIVTGVIADIPGRLEARVWPNPGRKEATLAYALPRAGQVRLRIYDVAGHQVASLVDKWQGAGRHDVTFAPRTRSGIYLYRLEWEGQSTSGKFAVMR